MSVKVGRKLEYDHDSIETQRALNKSGGSVAPGDVVILDTSNSTADSVAFTTTASADNKLVLGMSLDNIANNAYGTIQTRGPTDALKVDGTADIAVGDHIASFTTAKIAQKATSGLGGAFAVALEAYTTNDSSGVIDAYLTGNVARIDTSSQSATYGSPTLTGTITLDGAVAVSSTRVMTFAGSASATDALILTLGDILLSDGHLDIVEVDGTTNVFKIDHNGGAIASDAALIYLDDGGDIASGGNMVRLVPTGTPNAASILFEIVGAGKIGQAVYIDGDPTGIDLVHILCGGALTNGFACLGITNDGNLATGGALLNLTLGGTPDTAGRVIEIDGGSKDAIAMYIDSDAATESAIQILGSGAVANNKAMLDITNNGTMVAGSSLVRIGTTAAPTGATCYGLEIACNATNFEALYVSLGTSLFAEAVTMGTTAKFQLRDTGLYIYSSADGQLDIVADTSIHFGADGAGTDIVFHDADASAEVTVDASDSRWEFDGVDLQLQDADILEFGDDADATITWDGTNLIIKTIADDKLIEIGDSAATQLSWDMKIYGNTANGADYMYFDASDSSLYTTNYDIQIKDSDLLNFGTGASKAGDLGFSFTDGTGLALAATATAEELLIGDDTYAINTTIKGTLTVGKTNVGHDVKLWAA